MISNDPRTFILPMIRNIKTILTFFCAPTPCLNKHSLALVFLDYVTVAYGFSNTTYTGRFEVSEEPYRCLLVSLLINKAQHQFPSCSLQPVANNRKQEAFLTCYRRWHTIILILPAPCHFYLSKGAALEAMNMPTKPP